MIPHTPTPWQLDERYAQPHHICGAISIRDKGIKLIGTCQYGTEGRDEARANAAHIVRCVNEREELREALQRCLSYLADLNGSKWIEDDGPGGIDMRQRAKNLQPILYRILAQAEQEAQP